MIFTAKKSLGQHFLNSRHVLDQIISAAEIKEGETILEIGPGTGVLTEALLKTGAKVIAVEKDERSIEFLTNKFKEEIENSRLTLICGDILETPFAINSNPLVNDFQSTSDQEPLTINQPSRTSGEQSHQLFTDNQFAIVANIPYYITGAILEKFLEHEPRPNRMILLVQKEVAKRILGGLPGGEGKESILSISVKAFGTPRIIATVPPGAFTPPPKVDSVILAIENISAKKFEIIAAQIGDSKSNDRDSLIIDGNAAIVADNSDVNQLNGTLINRFFKILKAGFAHKRKYLIRNLESVIEKRVLTEVWKKLGLNEKIRPEDLTLDNWLDLVKDCGRHIQSVISNNQRLLP